MLWKSFCFLKKSSPTLLRKFWSVFWALWIAFVSIITKHAETPKNYNFFCLRLLPLSWWIKCDAMRLVEFQLTNSQNQQQLKSAAQHQVTHVPCQTGWFPLGLAKVFRLLTILTCGQDIRSGSAADTFFRDVAAVAPNGLAQDGDLRPNQSMSWSGSVATTTSPEENAHQSQATCPTTSQSLSSEWEEAQKVCADDAGM